MKKNVGNADRIIRVIMAAIFALLWFQNIVTGIAGIILLILSVILLLTSLVGFCPLYRIFRLNTSGDKEAV
ncbi:MAG TPA: DUF2892 domain-containing protein [Hanamia sp.]